jgi:hypothetical protein
MVISYLSISLGMGDRSRTPVQAEVIARCEEESVKNGLFLHVDIFPVSEPARRSSRK